MKLIAAAQAACPCELALVDVLPKPISFCLPLVRCIEGLRSNLPHKKQPCPEPADVPIPAAVDGSGDLYRYHRGDNVSIRAAETACLAAMQPNSCVCSVNRITWLLSRLQYSSTKTQAMLVQPVQEFDPSQDPAEGHAIADAGDRAQDGQEGSKEDERSTLDILQYSKDVAAAVDRSRVLAKSLHRTVEDVISSPALSLTIIKEHRELVRKAEMWRVLTSDSSLQFFVSDKAGDAAGFILDERPVSAMLFNDSIMIVAAKEPFYKSPDEEQLCESGNSNSCRREEGEVSRSIFMMYLLDASAKPIVCKRDVGHHTQSPSASETLVRQCSHRSSADDCSVGFCIALKDGLGRTLLVCTIICNSSAKEEYMIFVDTDKV
jgi:hypothetical protein